MLNPVCAEYSAIQFIPKNWPTSHRTRTFFQKKIFCENTLTSKLRSTLLKLALYSTNNMEHNKSTTSLRLDDSHVNASRDDGDKSFDCPICLETCSTAKAIWMDTCGHRCCQDCMKDYCAFHVSIRKVPVPCPVMMDPNETVVQNATTVNSSPGGKSCRFRRARSSTGGSSNSSSSHGNTSPGRQTSCSQFLSNEIVEKILLAPSDNQDCTTKDDNNNKGEGDDDSSECLSLWNKYARLNRLASDSSLVVCTRCDEVVSPPPSDPNSKVRSCPSCKHVFCAIHGDAHLGSSCEENDSSGTLPISSNHALDTTTDDGSATQTSRSSPASSPTIKSYQTSSSTTSWDASNDAFPWGDIGYIKPCSHCKAPIHKSGGCDHIVCVACHNDMCFRCGTHDYLSGKLTRFCSQCRQGYLDHRYLGRLRIVYCVCFPFLLPIFAIYSALALIAVLLSGCCFGLFSCGADLNSEKRPDLRRALILVGCILILPMLYMLYDAGLQWPWLQSMVDLVEGDSNRSNADNRNLGESHTLSSMEEGRQSHI